MRPSLLAGVAAAVLLGVPAGGFAQVERYELGRRVKRFEAEWERVTDQAARKRALAILPKMSTQFLSLNLPEAARTADDAYWALKSAEPPAAGVRWLDSLCVAPEKRAISGQATCYKVTVRPLYRVEGGPPAGATATLVGPQGHTVPVALDQLPTTTDVWPDKWLDGRRPHVASGVATALDGRITLRTQTGETTLSHTAGVSWLPRPDPPGTDRSTILAATDAAIRELALGLFTGDVPETDLPVQSWLSHKPANPYIGQGPLGNFWVVVPTGKDAVTPCRLFVSPDLAKDKPVPLVVALHGAGGSENMFFESYGAGHIVKECQKRGWLLVSPRSGLLTTPPVADIVAKLRERYPIDPKRVFLVGHSRGAGQAFDLVQRHPGTFAAVASLGGAGRVRQKEHLTNLPVFVGVGTADFALKSSRSLVKALADGGARRVTSKEYPDLEHLVIVREALPDVFAMFDGVGG